MSNSPVHTELERIAREYDRRSRELPEDFYAWSLRANLLFPPSPLGPACSCYTTRACFRPVVGIFWMWAAGQVLGYWNLFSGGQISTLWD